jgi:uncharacterized RDD family membrane protein YckC
VACQSCRQMAGMPNGISLASPLRRLGGYLMDGVLFVVTLGVGYLVWWVIALGRAQTPGKQVLGMKVLRLETIEPAGWGLMLLREVVAKGLTGARTYQDRPGALWSFNGERRRWKEHSCPTRLPVPSAARRPGSLPGSGCIRPPARLST